MLLVVVLRELPMIILFGKKLYSKGEVLPMVPLPKSKLFPMKKIVALPTIVP